MASAILGLVLDSSVLVAAERAKLTTPETLKRVRAAAPDVPIVISALSLAELAHGIYRADSSTRRQFVDELKAQIPVHAVTASTAEIIARIGGSKPPWASICLLEISSSEHALWNSVTQSEPGISETSGASLVCKSFHCEALWPHPS